jgi:hypothetical protein
LFTDTSLIRSLYEAAQEANMLSRLVVLAIPKGTDVPSGLRRGLAVYDKNDCSVSELTDDVVVVMPSKLCWKRRPVREKITQWALRSTLKSGASGKQVHVWLLDEASPATAVIAEGRALGLDMRVVSNEVGTLLALSQVLN